MMTRARVVHQPLPALIFGRPHTEWNLPLLKNILALFKKPLIARQHRTTMLFRLVALESETPLLEQYAVAQLVRRGAWLTRDAIEAWPKEEHEEEIFSDDGPDRFCEACNDVLPASKYRRTKLSPACQHECDICELCLKQGVNAQLSDGSTEWDKIHCPTCTAIIKPETVRNYVSGPMLTDYNEFNLSFHLRDIPNFRWCVNNDCHSGQIHNPGTKSPKITCVKCALESCFTHRITWNEGTQPGQHNEAACTILSTIETDTAVAKKGTKACPTCSIRILRDGGCSSMYCTYCRTRFEWYLALA